MSEIDMVLFLEFIVASCIIRSEVFFSTLITLEVLRTSRQLNNQDILIQTEGNAWSSQNPTAHKVAAASSYFGKSI